MTETLTAPSPQIIVGDLKANGYARARTEFPNTADVIEMLNYVDFLAMNNACSADDLPLPVVSGEQWKLTRSELTQLFFGHIDKKREADLKNIALPNPDIQKALAELSKRRKGQSLEALRRRVSEYLAEHDALVGSAYDYLSRARKTREEIDMIEGGDLSQKMVDDLIKALQETNWNFHKYNGRNVIEFVNRADVMLRYIEPKAGIRYELNCGKYKISVNLDTMQEMMAGHMGTVTNDIVRNIHPHIAETGRVCWGNAEQTIRDAKLRGDLATVLRVTDSLLQNYNEASPYVRIPEFATAIRIRDERERSKHGQKAKAKTAADGDVYEDQEIFDDEPDFEDDYEEGENDE